MKLLNRNWQTFYEKLREYLNAGDNSRIIQVLKNLEIINWYEEAIICVDMDLGHCDLYINRLTLKIDNKIYNLNRYEYMETWKEETGKKYQLNSTWQLGGRKKAVDYPVDMDQFHQKLGGKDIWKEKPFLNFGNSEMTLFYQGLNYTLQDVETRKKFRPSELPFKI